jgi:hypothetical protein
VADQLWYVGWQAVGPVAVTSMLLANLLPDVSGQHIPGTLFSSKKDTWVAYNPNTPGAYVSQQLIYNTAAVQVRRVGPR